MLLNGRYALGELLSSNYTGKVYRCWDRTNKVKCVVKLLYGIEKSKREVEVTKMVAGGSHFVNIFDATKSNDAYFLVMERCDMDLLDYVDVHGPFPEPEAKRVFSGILHGVRQLRDDHFVYHMDLKAENILLNGDTLIPKIIDFGSTCLATGRKKDATVHALPESTLSYFPPEMLRSVNPETTKEAFVAWSLGLILYRMLTKSKKPFETPSMLGAEAYFFTVENILAVFDGKLSDEAEDFLLSCLKRDRGDRPTLDEMVRHPWLKGTILEDETTDDEENCCITCFPPLSSLLKLL